MSAAPVGCLDGELLPCPFCGAQPKVGFHGDEDGGYHYTECMSCRRPKGLEAARFIGVHAESKADAIAAWNTRSASRQEGWQPISTAPKDGTDILLFCNGTKQQFVGFYIGDGKYQYAVTDTARVVCIPDLWQPLAAAPHQAQEAQGDRHGE